MQEQDAAAAEQLRQQAAMREQAEALQEAQAEQARQEAGGLEEYIRDNPDSTMARIAREREARERKKQQSWQVEKKKTTKTLQRHTLTVVRELKQLVLIRWQK